MNATLLHRRGRRGLRATAAALLLCFAGPAAQAADLATLVDEEVRSFLASRAAADGAVVDVAVPARLGLHGRESMGAQVVVSTSRRGPLKGRIPVTARLIRDGEVFERHNLTATISIDAHVWVADRRIARGELISSSDLRREKRDVTRGRGKLAREVSQLLGMRARRSISEGTPIRRDFVEAPPLVQRGETVRLRMVHGALRIEAKGVAREDGRAGQVIRVRTPESRRELAGTVGRDGVVDVRF